jgi:DNA-binding MarR family transcriptional regulator
MAAGLTPTQGQVLSVLRTHKGEGLRLANIAEALQVTPATASEAVATLVAKGLVRKAPSPRDARAIRLSLTDAGQREALAASRWPDFLLDVVEDLPEADQVAVLRAVLTLIASLQQRGLVPVAQMCVSCRFFHANAHPGEVQLHHCNLLNAPIGDGELRVHCPEQEPAPEALVAENFGRFVELRRSGTGPAIGKKRVRGSSSR